MICRRVIASTAVIVAVALSECAAAADKLIPVPAVAPGGYGEAGRVESITDGDTIRVSTRRDEDMPVRLIGIDTPEKGHPDMDAQCFAEEASTHTGELLPVGSHVRLVHDVERTDRYGRTLAYVYRGSDDLFVNLALARDGYARQLTVPPNLAQAEVLAAAVAQARAAQRGLWAAC